uniref:Uncharacterized protein n=1 Tax=Nelumbo nucifera TaxID=4432 RepID=A0A822ZRV7_NELNU|nr:TPA_asm: hypothetical protein HUJ06_004385 [Nelumbo nucifera]
MMKDPAASIVTPVFISDLLEKGFTLNTVGNGLFYSALPLLLWIFGPVLVFLCSVTIIPILYNLDFVFGTGKSGVKGKVSEMDKDFEKV